MDRPDPKSVWRHKKRGGRYEIITGRASLKCSGHPDIEKELENTSLTVYRSETGLFYVRPTREFMDGRFEAVPTDKEES